HHFHTDHPVFSCSIIEQKQLNTWVSFQSAEQPLLGQFSVSGNIPPEHFLNIQCKTALAAAAPSSSMEHTYNFIFMSCSGFDPRQRTSSQCIQRRCIHSTVDCQSIVQTECQSSRQAANMRHRWTVMAVGHSA
ncbi:hypothetical protein KZ835_34675, partial [Pseudomonas aeruginosa]|uniref:hypothetical protein n=1 Tax=Pseudomonas aeruginosa TaxID=287 RepID=UPI001CA47058